MNKKDSRFATGNEPQKIKSSQTIKPFFINSNICMRQEDISSYKKFMTSICGNAGNSYITFAIIKSLFGGLTDIHHIQNIYEYDFNNYEKDINYINKESTHVFLILQDQIRIKESYGLKLPYKKIIDFISRTNKPIIIAGLGANSFNGFDHEFYKKLDPNLIYFLKFLSDRCVEIGIRGFYTQEILHKLGIDNTRVIGCPSFFEAGKNRHIVKQELYDLNSVLITQRKFPFMSENHKIMQDYQEESIIKPIAFDTIDNTFFLEKLSPFINKTYHIFSDIHSWKTFIKNYKFAIGGRLHGSILAINAGIPALCLSNDSRATEMCEFLKIPHMPDLEITSKNDIFKIYDKLNIMELNKNYPKLYDNFIDFLHTNNLKHFSENKDIFKNVKYIKQPILILYKPQFYNKINSITFKLIYVSKYGINILLKPIKRWRSSINKRACRFIKFIQKYKKS